MKKILFLITVMLSLIAGDCSRLSDEEKATRRESALDLSGTWTIEGGAWGLVIGNEDGKNNIIVTLTRKGAVSEEEKNLIKGSQITEAEFMAQTQTLVFGSDAERDAEKAELERQVGGAMADLLSGISDRSAADGGENVSRDYGKTSEILSPLCAKGVVKNEDPLQTTVYQGNTVKSKVYVVGYCLTAKTQADTDPPVMDIYLRVFYNEKIEYIKADGDEGSVSINGKEAEFEYTATLTSQ